MSDRNEESVRESEKPIIFRKPLKRKFSSLPFPKLLVFGESKTCTIPQKPQKGDVGYDLSSDIAIEVAARGKALVSTGLCLAIPEGTYGRIAARSGLANKHAIDVGAGVIDPGYRGTVGIILFNHSDKPFKIEVGDRIAQLILEKVLLPEVCEVKEKRHLSETERGSKGFGSSGIANFFNKERRIKPQPPVQEKEKEKEKEEIPETFDDWRKC